ncbi:MAG: hypothetical protein QOI12_696 [Alphaproteobacteria bacterium]|jgi:hypothetical protein|nr:hypothetical protein [Alphaproteobacteria bacterium]
MFGWFRKRRIDRFSQAGRVVTAAALRDGTAPRPARLVRVNLGYGDEVWAHYGEAVHYRKADRSIDEAQLVLGDGDDPAALAKALGVPLERTAVRF